MILVVNPNPALDRVAVVNFREKSTLRPIRFSIWAGGSGTHAGYVAHLLGQPVTVVAFTGGHTGALFEAQAQRQGLNLDCVRVDGETRQTYTLLDANTGHICDVPEPGPVVTRTQAQSFVATVQKHLPDADLMILSGSIPPGCPSDLPGTLIAAAREAGVACIADVTGKMLLDVLPARPWLIKPSRTELADMLERTEVTLEDARIHAEKWRSAGAENVCISLDASGLLWASDHGMTCFTAPRVSPFNSVGCGDTLVGATAAAYVQHHDLGKALMIGIAAAAANITYDAPGYATQDDIARLVDQVQARPFSSEFSEAISLQDL